MVRSSPRRRANARTQTLRPRRTALILIYRSAERLSVPTVHGIRTADRPDKRVADGCAKAPAVSKFSAKPSKKQDGCRKLQSRPIRRDCDSVVICDSFDEVYTTSAPRRYLGVQSAAERNWCGAICLAWAPRSSELWRCECRNWTVRLKRSVARMLNLV